VEGTKRAMSQLLGKDDIDPVLVSAKEGIGIEELIDRLVKEIPAPNGDENAPLQALVFDSFYDTYKGVVSVVRIFNGQVRVGDRIRFWASGLESEVTEVGVFFLEDGAHGEFRGRRRGICGCQHKRHPRSSGGRYNDISGETCRCSHTGLFCNETHGFRVHLSY